MPGQAYGAQIALAARIVTVALDVELFYRVGGIDAVQTLLREHSGGPYDPAIVTLLQSRPDLCAVLEAASPWEAVLEHEPGPRPLIAEASCGMSASRAHRPALRPAQVEAELQAAVRRGQLDGAVVEAALAAAGHRTVARRATRPA